MQDIEEENSFFEQRSLENLIVTYRQELLQIIGGSECCILLPRSVRRQLRRNRILFLDGHKLGVTVKGMKMLDEEAS